MSNLSEKVFQGAIYNYAGKFGSAFFSILVGIYIIRKLSVSDYGVYNILANLIMISLFFTALGIPGILNRYIPEYYEKKQFHFLRKTAIGGLIVRFIAGIIFITIILIFSNFFVDYLHINKEIIDYLPVICIVILFTIESQLLSAILVALLEQKYWNISNLLYSAIKFILFFFALYLGYGLIGLLWCWMAVEGLLFFLYLAKYYSLNSSWSVNNKNDDNEKLAIRRMARYGLLFFYSTVGFFFLDIAIDNFIIAYFFDTTAVGLYSFAFALPLQILSFSPALILVSILIPVSIRQYTKNKDKRGLRYIYQLYNKLIFFSGVPMFVGLIFLSDKIILYVFNPAYITVLSIFVACSIFSAIKMFVYALDPVIQTLERAEIYTFSLIFAVYNLGMDLILIPRYGIAGAAAATLSAQFFTFLFQLGMTKRHISISYPWRAFGKMAINIAVMGVIVFSLRGFVNDLLSLGFVILIGGISYFICAYFNKGFDDKDRKLFNDAIGKDIFRF
jgi:O-antigen/teichoic acid export membrane protein